MAGERPALPAAGRLAARGLGAVGVCAFCCLAGTRCWVRASGCLSRLGAVCAHSGRVWLSSSVAYPLPSGDPQKGNTFLNLCLACAFPVRCFLGGLGVVVGFAAAMMGLGKITKPHKNNNKRFSFSFFRRQKV